MVDTGRRARLSVDINPELRRKVKMAAAAHDLTITAYVERAIEHALAEEGADAAWSRLSVAVFARDWQSEEDAVYDDVPAR